MKIQHAIALESAIRETYQKNDRLSREKLESAIEKTIESYLEKNGLIESAFKELVDKSCVILALLEKEHKDVEEIWETPDTQMTLSCNLICFLLSFIEKDRVYSVAAYGKKLNLRLSRTFLNKTDALDYLVQYEKKYGNANRVIHNAMQYELPDQKSKYNRETWKTLAKNHLLDDDFRKALPYAADIERLHRELKMEQACISSSELLHRNLDAIVSEDIKQNTIKQRALANKAWEKGIKTFNPDNQTKDKYVSSVTDKNQAKITLLKGNKEHLLKKGVGRTVVTKIQDKIDELNENIENEKNKMGEAYEKFEIFYQKGKQHFINVYHEEQKMPSRFKLKQTKLRSLYHSSLIAYSPKKLKELAVIAGYPKGYEDVKAANLIFNLGAEPNCFNEYLGQKKSHPSKIDDDVIPALGFDGKEIELAGYHIMRLEVDDPMSYFLGYPTGCCQSLGSAGSECAIYGSQESNSGFYVLRKGGDIVAQTWAWRNVWMDNNEKKISPIMVFDNVEYNESKVSPLIVKKMFLKLGEKILSKGVQEVRIGVSNYGLQFECAIKCPSFSEDLMYPPDSTVETEGELYAGYTDAENQKIIVSETNKINILMHYYPEELKNQYNKKTIHEISPAERALFIKTMTKNLYKRAYLGKHVGLFDHFLEYYIDIILSLPDTNDERESLIDYLWKSEKFEALARFISRPEINQDDYALYVFPMKKILMHALKLRGVPGLFEQLSLLNLKGKELFEDGLNDPASLIKLISEERGPKNPIITSFLLDVVSHYVKEVDFLCEDGLEGALEEVSQKNNLSEWVVSMLKNPFSHQDELLLYVKYLMIEKDGVHELRRLLEMDVVKLIELENILPLFADSQSIDCLKDYLSKKYEEAYTDISKSKSEASNKSMQTARRILNSASPLYDNIRTRFLTLYLKENENNFQVSIISASLTYISKEMEEELALFYQYPNQVAGFRELVFLDSLFEDEVSKKGYLALSRLMPLVQDKDALEQGLRAPGSFMNLIMSGHHDLAPSTVNVFQKLLVHYLLNEESEEDIPLSCFALKIKKASPDNREILQHLFTYLLKRPNCKKLLTLWFEQKLSTVSDIKSIILRVKGGGGIHEDNADLIDDKLKSLADNPSQGASLRFFKEVTIASDNKPDNTVTTEETETTCQISG
jgi:hypothetical protein